MKDKSKYGIYRWFVEDGEEKIHKEDFEKFQKNINDVNSLPESISAQELKLYFKEALDFANSIDNKNIFEIIKVLEVLAELSSKQWHTYQFIDETIKFNIEMFIKKILNINSLDYIQYIIEIVALLGLENSYKTIKDALNLPLYEPIRKEITEFVLEINDSIENPYSRI